MNLAKNVKSSVTLNLWALILTIILRTFFFPILAPQLSLIILKKEKQKEKRKGRDKMKTCLLFTKDVNINFI